MLSHINMFAFVVLVTLTEVIAPPGCNQDNCLRALSQNSTYNTAFCCAYTVTPGFGPTDTEVAYQCTSASTSISSACSCFVPSASCPLPTSSTTTTSTSTTSTSTASTTTTSTTTTSTTTTSTTTTSTTTTSTTPTSTPCAKNVCFSTQFNSQSVPSGDIVWLSAVFKPKFSGTLRAVSFTNSRVIINNVQVSPNPPDSFIQLDSSLQSCGTVQFVNGAWQTVAPLPGSGNTFLSAVSIPVPASANYANAQVTWCGDVTAPGEIDVQIAAAVYTSCSEDTANPEACETHTNYHAGVPTGCLNNLVAGGTGGGGSNFSGSLSATYPVCKTN